MAQRLIRPATLAIAVVLVPVLAAAQVELVVWHAFSGEERAAFEKVVDLFNRQYVDEMSASSLAVPPDAYATRITIAVQNGQGPDVFIFAAGRASGWVEAEGIMEPLDRYLHDEVRARFIPAAMAAMQYGDKTYGLPVSFEVATMIYNTDLVPSPPRTSSELITMARANTSAADGRIGLAYDYDDFYHHGALLNAFGGGVFAGGRDPVLNRPENVKSFELMMTWLDIDKVLPANPSRSLMASLFNQGDAAIVFAGPRFVAGINDDIPFALAILPTIDEAGGAPLRPWFTVSGAFMAASGRHQDYAYDLVRFVTSEEAGKVLALEGRQTPANSLVYDDAEVASDATLSAFREQVELAVPVPDSAEMALVWSPANAALSRIVGQTSSPQAALDQAQLEVEKLCAARIQR